MHSFVKSFLVGAVLCSLVIPKAQAEVFYLEDQDDRFSISFPDSWVKVINQKADDALTVAGAGVNDHAVCRVRNREERRYLIYPREMASEVQKVGFSKDFWKDYLGEYDDVVIDAFKDETGVGRAFSSMVEASYLTAGPELVRKRGMMFAGVYHDRLYIVDCSSEQTLYKKWRPVFLSIIKSVDTQKTVHELPSGDYRDFIGDGEVTIQGPKKLDVYKF